MIYVSIDTETTGTDPERHQVIEFGAVIEDAANMQVPLDQLPTFKRIIMHDEIVGQPFAINMNARVFREMIEPAGTEICKPYQLGQEFKVFLINNGFKPDEKGRVRIVAAGKNFATFDKHFLDRLPNWRENIRVSHKILDPGILYVDFINDDGVPSLDECKKRAGIEGAVAHDAVEDALDVIKLIRHVECRKIRIVNSLTQ